MAITDSNSLSIYFTSDICSLRYWHSSVNQIEVDDNGT